MSGFDVPSFVASFFDEAKDRLALIDQHLVAFEAGELSEEGLNSLRRDAHTIKGSALMLGITDVGDMAHLFEDAMETVIARPELRTAQMVQFLYDIHDQLAERLGHPDTEEPLDVSKFRHQFNQLLDQFKEGPTPDHAESADDEVVSTPTDEAAADTLDDDAGARHENGFGGFRPELARLNVIAPEAKDGSGRFLRVDADRLAGLSDQVLELTAAKSRFSSMVDGYGELTQSLQALRQQWLQLHRSMERRGLGEDAAAIEALDGAFDQHLRKARRFGQDMRYEQDKSAIVLNDIRDQILGLMLRPLDSIFSTFSRAVRDAAVRYELKVRLQIAGQSVEMDQGVAESLVEPLVHLLNNAIVHGIEAPKERRKAGKPEEGLITILATQSGNEVCIEVIDDGRGIDIDRIKAVAVERGITTQDEAGRMDSAEILELIFRPGFSTHEDIDNIAGRGMGMNIVQDTLRKLTGTVRIHTEKGEGTCFSLSLPVNITVQQSLQFRLADYRFGILTHLVEEVVPLRQLELLPDAGALQHVKFGAQSIPLVDLRPALQSPGGQGQLSDDPFVLIAKDLEGHVGIVVDELLEESEIIVRDIDPYLKRYQAPGMMGNSIVSDSRVLLLIEPNGIREMGRTAPMAPLQQAYLSPAGSGAGQAPDLLEGEGPSVLLVEDSLIAREVEKKMLLEAGFSVATAIDGMHAMEKIRAGRYDLLVTDLEMARLDGIGLIRQMRNDPGIEPGIKGMPALVISSCEGEEDRQRAMEAGADAYLAKQQLSRDRLAEVLHELLHR